MGCRGYRRAWFKLTDPEVKEVFLVGIWLDRPRRGIGTEKGAEIVFIDPGHGGHDPGRLRKDGDYNTI